jgi:hypothetical protein
MATTIANASSPVTMASRQRGRHVAAVAVVVPVSSAGVATAGGVVPVSSAGVATAGGVVPGSSLGADTAGGVAPGSPTGGAGGEPWSGCPGRAWPEGESRTALGSAAVSVDAAAVSVGCPGG